MTLRWSAAVYRGIILFFRHLFHPIEWSYEKHITHYPKMSMTSFTDFYRFRSLLVLVVGGTSGTTNACIATSTPGPGMQTSVSLFFASCGVAVLFPPSGFQCSSGGVPVYCSNIGCTSISCDADLFVVATANCITNNGVQLTCTGSNSLTCTRSEPATGITNSGGVSG